jgi:hypothetical protein
MTGFIITIGLAVLVCIVLIKVTDDNIVRAFGEDKARYV